MLRTERQDLPSTYSAHPKLESSTIITIVIIVTIIVIIIIAIAIFIMPLHDSALHVYSCPILTPHVIPSPFVVTLTRM